MQELNTIIENLHKNSDIDAVFLTGSNVSGKNPHGDIDLVIIINKNGNNLKSLYTWIDDIFADVFFYDLEYLSRIKESVVISGMDSVFVDWLTSSHIYFDKSGVLSELKEFIKNNPIPRQIPESEKYSVWQRINHNIVNNARYYAAEEAIYHEALKIRLIHSVLELITGYFTMRDIEWRGEKMAIKYLSENAPDFYSLFNDYINATTLDKRYESYIAMTELVFPTGYVVWKKNDVTPVTLSGNIDKNGQLITYWKKITGKTD